MKFEVEHTFRGVTAAEYEVMYFDEPFQIALCNAVKLERTVLRFDRGDERIVRHVRVSPDREIPAPVAKILGSTRFGYVEELEYEVGKLRGRWRTVPNVFADRVDAAGTLEFIDVDGGVKRVVRGTIGVRVLGLGGIVEKFVVGEVERSYADAAKFTAEWIARGKS